jgi:hypothetical protein
MSVIHLQALDKIREQDWHGAHQLIQQYSDPLACLIHGYLHRIEGDLSNAVPANSVEDELKRLFKLARQD